MKEKKRYWGQLMIMATVSLTVACLSLIPLRTIAFEQQRRLLMEVVNNQAEQLQIVSHYERERTPADETSILTVLARFADTGKHAVHFSRTGEFTLAEHQENNIVFLLTDGDCHMHCTSGHGLIPVSGKLRKPICCALHGEAGTMLCRDYQGIDVLAAYKPIPALHRGLVAKIDLAEIRGRFLRTILAPLTVTIVVVFLGVLFFVWIGRPLVRQEAEHSLTRNDAYSRTIIEERKKARADLLKSETARRIADEANAAKDDSLAFMSHELKTPLTGILGLAQSIRKARERGRMKDEILDEFLGNIVDTSEHLAGIIDDFLDISRIEAGGLQINYEPLDTRRVIGSVHAHFKYQAESKGLTFQVRIPEIFPLVRADQKRLTQVLANLVGNALKFTEKGFVIVEGRIIEDDHQHVRIVVSDSGCGIPAPYLSRVFDRFCRAENSVNVSGAGLGLTISRSLVEMMGGRIWVESEVGIGSTFSFTLRKWQEEPDLTG